MESVILIAPREYDAEIKARLAAHWNIEAPDSAVWMVTDGTSCVYVARNDWVWGEVEPEWIERVVTLIPRPVFYSMDFSDIVLCKRVLFSVADDPALLVDNDHGVTLWGPEFLRLLLSREDWDWRGDKMPV